jgi:hypothetical protein
MGLEVQLICARFALTLGHFIALLMAFSFVDDSVSVSFSSDASGSEISRAKASLRVRQTLRVEIA